MLAARALLAALALFGGPAFSGVPALSGVQAFLRCPAFPPCRVSLPPCRVLLGGRQAVAGFWLGGYGPDGCVGGWKPPPSVPDPDGSGATG